MALVAAPPMMQPQQPQQALAALWPGAPVAAASTSAAAASTGAPSALRRSGVLKLIRTDFWQKHQNEQLVQRHAIAKHRAKEAIVREVAQKEAARAKQDARDQRKTADDAFAEKCRREKPQPVMQLPEHRIKAILAGKDPTTDQPKKRKTDMELLVEASSAAQILAKITYPSLAIAVELADTASVLLKITAENRQSEMMKALAVPGSRAQLAKARQQYARARAQEREAALAKAARRAQGPR